MSRLEGMSYEAIGRELGLSKNTVKGHMVLALHYLRIYVRDHADITIICFLLLQPMLQNNF
jgi:RNA polymerase sigma-70 factor (ECF subfamily)